MEPMRLLRSFFSEATLNRGMAYAEDNRVSELELEPYGPIKGAEQWLLHAEVEGERDKVYHISLLLLLDKGHLVRLSANCSCPVGNYCKHAVAALLVWLWQEPLLVEGQSPAPRLGSSRREDRLPRPEFLELAELKVAGEERYRLSLEPLGGGYGYLLKRPGLGLRLWRQRRLKSGAWSKPQMVNWRTWEPSILFGTPQLPAEFCSLMVRLSFLPELGNNLGLDRTSGSWLLPELLATGLLHWQEDETPLRLGPARPGQLHWVNEEPGKWRLALTPVGEATSLLPFYPFWYRDSLTGEVGPVEQELHPSWFDWVLNRRLLLDADLLFLCQSELGSALPACPLPVASAPAQSRLSFKAMDKSQYPVNSRRPFWVAVLEFDYDGDWLPAARPVPMQSKLGDRLHYRHLQTETRWLARLADLGLVGWGQRLDLPQLAQDRHQRLVPSPLESVQSNLSFWQELSRQIPALRRQGLQVDWPAEFGAEPEWLEASDWLIDVEEQPQSDWFELKLGVQLGSERLDLLPALKSLLANRPDLERFEHSADADWPLALPDGRVLSVPQAKLKLWLKPILGQPPASDALRLPRWQAADLAELEASGRWLGSESIRRLAERLAHFEGIEPVEAPAALQTQLRPYQLQGLGWLQFLREYDLAGVLADDMGLGKTVQTLAHLLLEQQHGRLDRPALVVAPTSLLPNWRSESARLAPSLKVVTLHGSKRDQQWALVPEAQLVLISYPLLARDQKLLSQQPFHLVVFDEAQQLKTPSTQQYKAALTIQARHRLALTGTPLENHLGELWSLFQQLLPGLLGSQADFKRQFRTPIEQGDSERQQLLAQRVRPFILRRHKREVVTELPDKTEIPVWLELTEAQRDLYEAQRLALDAELRKQIESSGLANSQIHILAALLRLRQICCDPALVEVAQAGSAKLDWLEQTLPELIEEGRRVLIFSQFTQLLGRVERLLGRLKLEFVSLTGDTRDRELPVVRFQRLEVPVFLLSLKAGGTGLNLTAADTLIHLDPWWNPAVTEQATARAWRIGQTNEVFVYKLYTLGTVEEKILALQQRKQAIADNLLAGSLEQAKLDASELRALLSPVTDPESPQ